MKPICQSVSLAAVLWAAWFAGCQRQENQPPQYSAAELHSLEQQAALGDAEAEFTLAVAFEQGLAGKPDPAKAIAWYERAAAHGHGRAEVSLGLICRHGDGRPRDAAAAADWFRRAADRDLHDAQFYLAELYRDGEGVKPDAVQALKWFTLAAKSAQRIKEAPVEAEKLAKGMTPAQIAEANRLADEFTPAPGTLRYPPAL